MADSLKVRVAMDPGVFGSGMVIGELPSLCYYGFLFRVWFFVLCVTARATEHGK